MNREPQRDLPRVLVVEDDPSFREVLIRQIGEVGAEPEGVSNAEAALARIEKDLPDLVITDLFLEGMDGIELCRRIKERTREGFLPVILISGQGNAEMRQRGFDQGADEFLPKPCERLELLARVRTMLKLKSLQDSLGERNAVLKAKAEELEFALKREGLLLDELRGQNRELKELLIVDHLTGLYNHPHFMDRLAFQFQIARRYRQPLSCLFADIDFFKSVNDTYGHLVGSQALKEVAVILQRSVRDSDVVARYGGDEFAVLLPNTGLDVAALLGERLRAEVEAHTFIGADHPVRITISLGVSAFRPYLESKDLLVHEADQALYQAKQSGRNRVVVFHDPEQGPRGRAQDTVDKMREIVRRYDAMSKNLKEDFGNAVLSLIGDIESPREASGNHALNVAILAVRLARRLGIADVGIEKVRYAALFHDIGKMEINPDVLARPSGLSGEEMALVREHPERGARILENILFLQDELPMIRGHHEWYDGSGYPEGLKGEEIPVGARILALAESYDSMVSGVPYRAPFPRDRAIEEIRRCAGTQFDPKVAAEFIEMMKQEIPAPAK